MSAAAATIIESTALPETLSQSPSQSHSHSHFVEHSTHAIAMPIFSGYHESYALAPQTEHEALSTAVAATEPFIGNPVFNSEWDNNDNDNVNDFDNDIDNNIEMYDTVPVDLTNDIEVNNIAAANPNFPINPDAEIIDVTALGGSSSSSSSSSRPVAATQFFPARFLRSPK